MAASKHGKNKCRGRALTEAMARWAKAEGEKDAVARTLFLMEPGLDLGGVHYGAEDVLRRAYFAV